MWTRGALLGFAAGVVGFVVLYRVGIRPAVMREVPRAVRDQVAAAPIDLGPLGVVRVGPEVGTVIGMGVRDALQRGFP